MTTIKPGTRLYASHLGAFHYWTVERPVEGSDDWICKGPWRKEHLSKLRNVYVYPDCASDAIGALTFDFEDVPLIGYIGRQLDIRAQGRCEVHEDGTIRRVEILTSPDGKHWDWSVLDKADPIYPPIVAGIVKDYAGHIQDLIADYAASRAERVADKRNDDRKHGFY